MCNRDAHRWGTRSVLTVSSFLFSSFTFSKRNIFDRKWKECDHRALLVRDFFLIVRKTAIIEHRRRINAKYTCYL